MKGGIGGAVAAAPSGGKRRWKGVALAMVLALVAFSLLVPLGVLLGLQNKLPYGYSGDGRLPSESGFGNYGRLSDGQDQNQSKGDQSRVNDLVRRFGPAFPEADRDIDKKIYSQSNGDQSQSNSWKRDSASHSESKGITPHSKGPSMQQEVSSGFHPTPNTEDGGRARKKIPVKSSNGKDIRKTCQLEFGSYCLWSIEHKEVMKDSTVKRLKDQLFVARAYFPSIAKLKRQNKLSHELKQNIQEFEHMLSEAISDADLPRLAEKKIQKMDLTIVRAKACTVDCNNVDKKLRQILDLMEDEAHFHMKQSAFLHHLGVQTMPRSLHCLSMKSTVEYFRSRPVDTDHLHGHKLDSPSFRHYVIFSVNIIAASVTINSTMINSKETGNIVFHVLTDGENYYAMKLWFSRNSYKHAAIRVLNIEDLNLKPFYNSGLPLLSMSEEFRVSVHSSDQSHPLNLRIEYISVFGHSHFRLPQIFKNLKRVVVLDDDMVIQQDLSSLWDLDMEGKVNGAVQLCGVRLGQLKSFFGSSRYNDSSCAWMSGLNIIDLEKWREHDVTGIYQQLLQKLKIESEETWRVATLSASLLAFEDLIYPVDSSLVVSGLGYDYGVNLDTVKHALALHYNGNMKPWLELGIPKYKKYWKNFLNQEEKFMEQCNVNP